MGKVRTRSQSVAKKKPPKKKKSGISKPKSSGKCNPKLLAKSGGTAANAASKKGDVSPLEDSNNEDSEYEGTETEDNDNDVETTNGDYSSSDEDRKVSAKRKCQGSNSPKNGEGAMIHAVTRDAVTVILPPMLLLAEVVLHAAPVPPPEKIQVKACLLFIFSEYNAIIS
jgi:hypothetical protein